VNKRRPPAWRKMLVMLVVLAALGAVWRYTPLKDVVTVDNAVNWAHELRKTPGAPVMVVLSYVVAAVIMFPRPLLTLTTIVAFGTLWGVTYCGIGILVAALTFFYAGKFLPRHWLEKLAGDKLEGVEALFHEHGIKAIFALNMVPAPPFAVQGLIAGACEMSTFRYIVGNLLGMLPTLIGWGFFGHQLVSSLEDASSVNKWLIGAMVAVMVVLTIVVRRWVAKHSPHGDD
jgi:uncharacterized membrane protein YdjX (TVP38/TMEM64 family)